MDKKIKFVIVGKDENFSFNDESEKKLFSLYPELSNNVVFERIPNNKENITIIYNRELNKERETKNYDFLVFLHADVIFDIKHFIDKLVECENKYDVIGLCGCVKIDTSKSPLNWFTGSMKFPDYRIGCVTHGELGNKKSFFSVNKPYIKDSKVACIDGLCIAFTRKALETGISFDENLKFNCYDTQISFDAILTYKLNLGVIVEESLVHYSVGCSILSKDFKDDEKHLRKRFNIELN